MSATVKVYEGNEAAIAYTEISGTARFCCADNPAPLLATPIPIPSGGQGNYAYSWWKHFFLDFSGTFTRINNIKIRSDGTIGWTFGTDGAMLVGIRDTGDNGCPAGSYLQATGSASTGNYMDDGTNGHTYYKDQTATPADIESYTDGSELQVDTQNIDVAGKSDAVVLQLKVDGDATLGEQADETLTFEFDEI